MTSSRSNEPPKRDEPDYPSPTLYTDAAVRAMESDKRKAPMRLLSPIVPGSHRKKRNALIELARKARAELSRRRESDGQPEPPEAA